MHFYIVMSQLNEDNPTIASTLSDTITPHFTTPTLLRVSAGYYQIDNGGYYNWQTAPRVHCAIKNIPATIGSVQIYQESASVIAVRSFDIAGLSIDINGTVEVYIDLTLPIETYEDTETGVACDAITETTLFSVTPSRTVVFANYQDKFEINSYGYFGADANTKRLRAYANVGAGNEPILDTGNLAITALTYWHIRILSVRVSTTNLWVFAEVFTGSSVQPTYILRTLITDADLDNTDPLFYVTGTTTTAGLITSEYSYSLTIPRAITDYS